MPELLMIRHFRILIYQFLQMGVISAAPVGICLHAYSPQAPAGKIECFEFEKVERNGDDYRFFPNADKSVVVTGYRFRGTIPYKPELVPSHPGFEELLKLYEETARATPSTRPYLNHRILAMRDQLSAVRAEQRYTESLPRITLGGVEYLAPKFKGIENGKLVLAHKNGVAKFDTSKITDQDLLGLSKIDPKIAKIKVLEISRNRIWNPVFKEFSRGKVIINHENGTLSLDIDLISDADFEKITLLDPDFGKNKAVILAGKKIWNPTFDGMSSNSLKIKHEKGHLSIGLESISDSDRETIMSWSDGTWKIGKPGFYNPKPGGDSYGELILEDGRFHADVRISNRVGETIQLMTAQKTFKLPIRELANTPGLTRQDVQRIEDWSNEIVEERLSLAKPEISTQILLFDEAEILTVTDVRVKILQVLDEGVLASKFIGKLHKGTEKRQSTRTINVEHPVTGVRVSRVVDTSIDEFEITEEVTDDLCYIVGNTRNLVDGEIVTAASMKLMGRYQYTDVRGAQRSVRKYFVD